MLLFPLPSCVLFPGALLPLHVFEQRYRRMIHDVIAQPEKRRYIAVSLLRPNRENLCHSQKAPEHSQTKCLSQNCGTGFLTCHLTGWKAALDRLSRSHRGFGMGSKRVFNKLVHPVCGYGVMEPC